MPRRVQFFVEPPVHRPFVRDELSRSPSTLSITTNLFVPNRRPCPGSAFRGFSRIGVPMLASAIAAFVSLSAACRPGSLFCGRMAILDFRPARAACPFNPAAKSPCFLEFSYTAPVQSERWLSPFRLAREREQCFHGRHGAPVGIAHPGVLRFLGCWRAAPSDWTVRCGKVRCRKALLAALRRG